jgi:hypothetical protein
MPELLSDQRREEIREMANPDGPYVTIPADNHETARAVNDLLAELDRLHTWPGLMSLLDEHYPADVQLGPDDEPGPRILALVREVDRLRKERDEVAATLPPLCAHCGERNRDGCYSEHDNSWMCAPCYVAAAQGEER